MKGRNKRWCKKENAEREEIGEGVRRKALKGKNKERAFEGGHWKGGTGRKH